MLGLSFTAQIDFDSCSLCYQRFETARQDLILHPELLVGKPEIIR
jgi:hypothetical protein